MRFVVTYDIEKDRTRNKVSKILSEFGVRVQLSVFECQISKKEMADLTERLEGLIKSNADSIIFYSQCENCQAKKVTMGALYLERRISFIEV